MRCHTVKNYCVQDGHKTRMTLTRVPRNTGIVD